MDYVLVVDDDTDVREVLCDVIEEAGYKVASAENGQVALEHLQANPPPFLILLDLMMPTMDGLQFRAKQKQVRSLAVIPVAVLSAAGRNTRASGLDGTLCLKKPIDLDELLKVVEKHFPIKEG